MENFSYKLERAIMLYNEMKLTVDACKRCTNNNVNPWSIFWDSFWGLSNEFPFTVDWCDYDTSYEEDIMQRYNAIENFMEGLQYQEYYNEQQ